MTAPTNALVSGKDLPIVKARRTIHRQIPCHRLMKQAQLKLAAPHNVTLGYTEWGKPDAAQTILCVHGLTRNARDFDFLAKALADKGARVIALNMVGRGTSSWLADPDGLHRSELCRTCPAIHEEQRLELRRLGRDLDGRPHRHAHRSG